MSVEQVPVLGIRWLRRQVLRPDQPAEASVYPEDETAVHLAAYDDSRVVGCATIFPEALGDAAGAWRLRGMATLPEVRGRGFGAELVTAAVRVTRDARAPLLWCNARVAAVGFYERQGFEVVSEEFDVPPIGPHRRMLRRLDPATAAGE